MGFGSPEMTTAQKVLALPLFFIVLALVAVLLPLAFILDSIVYGMEACCGTDKK